MLASDLFVEVFTPTGMLGLCLAYLALSLILSSIRSPKYPQEIKWLGQGKGWFSSFKHTKDWLQEGYEMYGKQDKAYVLPGMLGSLPEVVLPQSQISWMLDQPDNVLSTSAAHYDVLEGTYNFVNKAILEDPYHEHVVHRSLARNLNGLIPELQEEDHICIDSIFGTDEKEWKTINIWDAMMQFVPRLTNIMLVGKPVCETKGYLDAVVQFTNDVVRNMLLLQIVPGILRPIVGPLAGLANWYHYKKTARYTMPLVNKRLEDMARKEKGDPAYKDWTPPNDYITWHIQLAKSEGRTDELRPKRITQRLMPLNFAAIHTTVLTAHSTLLDTLASDEKDNTVALLREEAERVWAEEGGQWTKAGLARLYRIDSAIRESMRFSTIARTLVQKKVVASQGVTNPATGWHFAKGTMLTCPIWEIQHDPDLLGDKANEYDAFRFSREREAYAARADADKNLEDGLRLKQSGMVTTSVSHLSFGHGRHACPGRFFAANELKMFFAYMVMNYDVRMTERERPQGMWIMKSIVPPVQATIQVKRRVRTA